MMRPMKLAGDQLMFGEGCLAHLETLPFKKAFIVTSGRILEETGILPKVREHLTNAKMQTTTFYDVEPDPSFNTIMAGANEMKKFNPDVIIAVGGGSAMDAAKGMWIYYEHEELSTLEEILPPNQFPTLRNKAKMVCIPSTSGTASEVSRSIVVTDNVTGFKHGLGNMEMMPDYAICDPLVTASMPKSLTAATGMDALTHAVEAFTSNRANHVSDVLAVSAIKDIINNLVNAYNEPTNLVYRENMLNASVVAGMAFTNVSLGIVHSIAHTLGSYFHVPHGLANAIMLPYVIRFNMLESQGKKRYQELEEQLNLSSIINTIEDMNKKMNIPASLNEIIKDEDLFTSKIEEMAAMSLKDGCTKTNPVIPTFDQFKYIIKAAYHKELIGE
ncbi:NADPH-dependent butanol dehydrogenase [Candidatus Izimaplasma bacterium ZiA1]|uniref:iron-containing alcohol dehydrogenase n=1 Tax=Candidatus Izimoplasma sp. ZiA1 TaxID=2024899 RepID=UPI000BAA6D81|nr:NADPH-dependent butanol dehydrogenase [Candidatus Izimaplasma bacterium ZiA1]